MDFEIISWHERSYKLVSFFVVTVISIALVCWCYMTQFETSIVFFASVLYALFLFLIGLYINNMSSKLSDHITERAETYNRLKSIFSKMDMIEKMPFQTDRINSFREITGRREEDIFRRKGNGDDVFFEIWGKYKMPLSDDSAAKIDKLEKRFLDKNSEICNCICGIIFQFISQRLGVVYSEGALAGDSETCDSSSKPQIVNAITFSIENWCSANRAFAPNPQELIEYYKSHADTPKIMADIKDLEKSYSAVEKLYAKYRKKAEMNIKRIQRAYGKQIDYEAKRLYELSDSFGGIGQIVDEATQSVEGLLSEVFDFLKDVEQRLTGLEGSTENIYDRCESIEEKLNEISERVHDHKESND